MRHPRYRKSPWITRIPLSRRVWISVIRNRPCVTAQIIPFGRSAGRQAADRVAADNDGYTRGCYWMVDTLCYQRPNQRLNWPAR
jgi:hypothetical protein